MLPVKKAAPFLLQVSPHTCFYHKAPLPHYYPLIRAENGLKSILSQDDIDALNDHLAGQTLDIQKVIIERWFDIVELSLARQETLEKQNGYPATQLWIWCKVAAIEAEAAQKLREIEELAVDGGQADPEDGDKKGKNDEQPKKRR